MTKTLDTLISDVDQLMESGFEVSDKDATLLAESLTGVLKLRLSDQLSGPRKRTLRMSNLGKPDRQLWYEIKSDLPAEQFRGNTLRKFLFGDIWEAVILWLCQLAGHTVEKQQAEVEVDGVVGHIDAVVDGVLVDVKSASTYAFKKFRNGTLQDDDPFGYYDQLAGYAKALDLDGAWLAVDKTTGSLALLRASAEELGVDQVSDRITHIRGVLESDTAPERCYAPVDEGKSGNQILSMNCSYCPFKFDCWSDANDGIGLRTFLYYDGPKHFVTVVKEPQVKEITF
jgi:hypothetical protein